MASGLPGAQLAYLISSLKGSNFVGHCSSLSGMVWFHADASGFTGRG